MANDLMEIGEKVTIPDDSTNSEIYDAELQEELLAMNISHPLVQKISDLDVVCSYPLTEAGNGELFADLFKVECRYNETDKVWMIYDGKVWVKDTEGLMVARRAKLVEHALEIYYSAKNHLSRNISDEQKHYRKLGNRKNRVTMIEDAKDKYFFNNEQTNSNPYLFNCINGVYDLKTGIFRDHRADDLMTKISNVNYDPMAVSSDFINFITDIMMGDMDKVEFLQKLLGYSLSGDCCEEAMYIFYGATTRNGKSTLMETIAYMLGNTDGYAMNMRPESLAFRQNTDSRTANGDIARLQGVRFLVCSEPPKRMIFDVGLVKLLTGRDSITARELYSREFEFTPMFKLMMNTNFLPIIGDDSLFSSGRINVIEFNKHFTEQMQDKGLKNRLKESHNISGVFNWCVEGYQKYLLNGLVPPQSVKDATAVYRKVSDKVGTFIEDALIPAPNDCIKASNVYAAYRIWCSSNGYSAENKKNFFAELRSKSILSETGYVNGKTVRNAVVGYSIDNEYTNFLPVDLLN